MSALSGTVNLPKIGPVKKVYVYGIGGAAAAYVGLRYWRARSAPADALAGVGDGSTGDGSSVTDFPAGSGSASGNVQYAGTTDETGTSDLVLTNDQWTGKALDSLEESGWDRMTVLTAIGKYLMRQPLTTAEQTIVQNALAAVGAPPVGTFTIMHETGSSTDPGTTTPGPALGGGSGSYTPGVNGSSTATLPSSTPIPIVDAPPNPNTGSVSTPPVGTPTGPIYAAINADENIASFQSRQHAGLGFATPLDTLRLLNPGHPKIIEAASHSEKHKAATLRVK